MAQWASFRVRWPWVERTQSLNRFQRLTCPAKCQRRPLSIWCDLKSISCLTKQPTSSSLSLARKTTPSASKKNSNNTVSFLEAVVAASQNTNLFVESGQSILNEINKYDSYRNSNFDSQNNVKLITPQSNITMDKPLTREMMPQKMKQDAVTMPHTSQSIKQASL